jgi:hypothetical protein
MVHAYRDKKVVSVFCAFSLRRFKDTAKALKLKKLPRLEANTIP